MAVPKWEGTRIRIELRKKNASKQKKTFFIIQKKNIYQVSIKSAKSNDVWVNVVDQAHFKERGRNIWKKRKNILQILVSFIIIMIVSIMFTTIIGFLKTVCLLNGFHLSCMSNIFVIKHWWRNRQTKQNLHPLKNCLRNTFERNSIQTSSNQEYF